MSRPPGSARAQVNRLLCILTTPQRSTSRHPAPNLSQVSPFTQLKRLKFSEPSSDRFAVGSIAAFRPLAGAGFVTGTVLECTGGSNLTAAALAS